MSDNSNMLNYESMVQRNIEENRRMLISLGLLQEKCQFKKTKPPQEWRQSTARQKLSLPGNLTPDEGQRRIPQTRRFSLRSNPESNDEDIGEENYTPETRPKVTREQRFGEIEGVSVGDWWATRVECSVAGVHRPTVAGIHAKAGDGCYSIALSGGYEDDLDCGEYFTYTGSGGRDLKGTKLKPKNLRTAPQSKDQVLEGINAAVAMNIETGKPVRVIRGYRLQSPFAPEEGYRYDGLYSVEKCWSAIGLSGFNVCKYALKRVPFQDPPPWKALSLTDETGSVVQTSNGRSSAEANINGANKELPMTEGEANTVPSENLTRNEHLTQHGDHHSNTTKTVLTPQSPNMKTNVNEGLSRKRNDFINHFANGFKGFPSSPQDAVHSDDNSAGSSVSDGMIQPSILKYFQRTSKPTKNNKCSNTVNPKALRNNRFSSLWTLQADTNMSKVSRKRQSAPVVKSDTGRVPNPEFSNTSEKLSVMEDLLENGKENLTEPNVVISKRMVNGSHSTYNAINFPPLRPCFVKLLRDDCFIGWDCFHGFEDDK